jgi:hypothetical protein
VTGSSVDSTLYFFKSRFKSAGVTFKVDINIEEGLKSLFRSISSATDSFFHLVEGVLGGVEKGLIHRPVVVLRELLNLFS